MRGGRPVVLYTRPTCCIGSTVPHRRETARCLCPGDYFPHEVGTPQQPSPNRISLDRDPCFAERNRPSAKASRLRLRATAESASPRARPLRCRARGLCHAARSSGQLDLPRQPLSGVPECLEASRRSVYALAAPAWLGVGRASIGYGRPASCVTGFRDLATCAAWADHDTVTILDWCVE